jgi:hypothetical protein
MANDADVTSDAVSRAVVALFDLGRLGIDWAIVGRAVAAHREESRQRWLDHHDELTTPAPEDDLEAELARRAVESGGDLAALGLRAESTLLASLVRVARDWQRLLAEQSPRLQRAVDHYSADPDPAPELARAVVDEVARMAQEAGTFMRDQGALLERDVLALQSQLLDVPALEPMTRPRARVKP